ncbi:hypothetical protein FJTKL_12086 [Diaporthe vaccinii]|uniref:Uncharacterized protein n=1 Tax=Diaporthe vaccinii TaxID=105482 RepID=A0ABR4EFK2_9PEZI
MGKKKRSGKGEKGDTEDTKSIIAKNAALIAKMKADIKALQSTNTKAKRAEKKKNKVYNDVSERDAPCIGCANSAASGKSVGNCLDAEADDGNRCTRYDRGSNVCADIPLVLVPVALHLCALRKALPKGYENYRTCRL